MRISMTEQEAIEFLKGYTDEDVYTEKCINAHKTAISALEEIQQYRALGTVDDIKKIIGFLSLDGEKGLIDDATLLNQYRMLGTVEELKEAREKQIAKKVIKKTENADGFRTGYVACPNCGAWVVRPISMNGCSKCLQRLDWSEI